MKKNGIIYSETFDETAKKVMELSCGHEVELKKIFDENIDIGTEISKFFAQTKKYFRAILCGGSIADETQILWKKKMRAKYIQTLRLTKNLCSPTRFSSIKKHGYRHRRRNVHKGHSARCHRPDGEGEPICKRGARPRNRGYIS
ncbi:MAG: hypothetical protein L6V93_20525 [Clostridiales bacterium]|nr:MAG: hypothetical protein L6V93_20525 [Clostridiales bacterium]